MKRKRYRKLPRSLIEIAKILSTERQSQNDERKTTNTHFLKGFKIICLISLRITRHAEKCMKSCLHEIKFHVFVCSRQRK